MCRSLKKPRSSGACVCVNHLKRRKTSNLGFLSMLSINLQGAGASWQASCQRRHLPSAVIPDLASLAYLHCCDYLLFRACFHSIFILQSVRVNGNRLSPERARRFVFHFMSALSSQSANFLTREWSASNSINSSTGYGDGSFLILCRASSPTHLSGVIGVFLHVRCIPQQKLQ